MEPLTVFDDLDMRGVAARLVAARHQARLQQQVVAWRAELNASHYNEIERGLVQDIKGNTLYKLCQVLGVSADWLLGLATRDASL